MKLLLIAKSDSLRFSSELPIDASDDHIIDIADELRSALHHAQDCLVTYAKSRPPALPPQLAMDSSFGGIPHRSD